MGGSIHRLVVVWLALLVAACDPSPVVTQVPSGPTSTPIATATPSTTATPTTTPAPPTSIDLPLGFDAIPWARAPFNDGDADTFPIAIGILGKPATTTRTSTSQPTVWADGEAVLIEINGATEVVDAGTGTTIARYDRNELELDGVPPNNLNYYFARRFITDVARGYLYLLSSNRDGVQLRRFDLDGSNEALLAVLGPDPGRDAWDADVVLGPSGEVIATACPSDPAMVVDFRCRLYVAPSGADGPIRPRFLPAKAPRPCFLMAASESWLIGSQYEYCHADGGSPVAIPYFAVNLGTLRWQTTLAESSLSPFGAFEREGEPFLVANLGRRGPLPSPYPYVAIVLGFASDVFNMDALFYADVEDYPEDPALADTIWGLHGWGLDWSVLRAFGAEFASCMAGRENGDWTVCPSGPVILRLPEGLFELPSGTWGEIVPPPGRASSSIGP